MTIKLLGVRLSNYYNVVKAGLLEKDIAFEEVKVRPSQEEAFLAKSPLGKVPVLELEDGTTISESQAIFTYLEHIKPEPALFPKDALAAARARQIQSIIDLYVDAPIRPCLSMIFSNRERDQAVIEPALAAIEKGLQAIKHLAVFDPYITGKTFTYADLGATIGMGLALTSMQALNNQNPRDLLEGYQVYAAKVFERPAVKKTMDDYNAAVKKYRTQQQP